MPPLAHSGSHGSEAQDNAVDLDVSYLVQKQVKDRLGPTDKLTDQDVPVLSLLSRGLLAELRLEVFVSSS